MSDEELRRLEAEARYARERFQLYKARAYGPKPTDPARLRELEGSSKRAATRLRRAATVPECN
ncbi:MAG: hypothetical protein ACRDK9_01075 [Solirubrobacterales bacterium]